jgi:3-oxoacyl-[acyl-carrier-protein] synthase-3
MELYRNNTTHPLGKQLWVSPALFSDAAAALVLRRAPEVTGFSFYSRDSHSFGDEPGFTDPIIHYPGGGVAHPPGTQGAAELSCYGIVPAAVKEYYTKGMMLNHEALTKQRPGYVEEVRRIYTHQASPALVEAFAKMAALPPDKAPSNARRLGNLVSASTAQMLHDDLQQGVIRPGDEICLSVVGAGPERGAFILPVATKIA